MKYPTNSIVKGTVDMVMVDITIFARTEDGIEMLSFDSIYVNDDYIDDNELMVCIGQKMAHNLLFNQGFKNIEIMSVSWQN